MKVFRKRNQALMTDLYQLTMAAGYFKYKRNTKAVFELFVRDLCPRRSYLVVAGIEQALDYLETLSFSQDEIEFLKKLPLFKHVKSDFFKYLKDFRFTGDVYGIPEGTPIFSNEPILQVVAPIIEAQIVETFLLSIINFETMIATKASRMFTSAKGKGVIDFGSRRAQGPEAGVLAARASFIGGCIGTSNVYAGKEYNIPIYGTIAHSWIMSFEDEMESFEKYNEIFPENTILLIDTYDTVKCTKKLKKFKGKIKGVRIDSGDIEIESRKVRKILDSYGMEEVKIVASSDLNEYVIDKFSQKKAPIDFYGVGTELVTSPDAPSIGGVYKLVEIIENGEKKYKLKLSSGKSTLPGKKQIFRKEENGIFKEDVLGLMGEEKEFKNYTPLLQKFMENGKIIRSESNLNLMRDRTIENLSNLEYKYKDVNKCVDYPVKLSENLKKLREKVSKKYGK